MGILCEGHQLRGARAIARITLEELAGECGISARTLSEWESSDQIRARTSNIRKVQTALEARGVVFVDTNGEGPGVRRKKNVSGQNQ